MTGPSDVTDALGPVCAFCGATLAADGESLLTWTTAVEAGLTKAFCPACSREHLRAIEGKLDSAWW